MSYTFEVVTKVPKEGSGNLAMAWPLYVEKDSPSEENHWLGTSELAPPELMFSLRQPVFTLGEIMIMDPATDREISSGAGRKPSKWMIETEDFATLEEAVKRSKEVTGE